MDFCAVIKRYAGFGHHRRSTEGPRLDGISGVLRLLADVALKTLVSYWMFPENKERDGGCLNVSRNKRDVKLPKLLTKVSLAVSKITVANERFSQIQINR